MNEMALNNKIIEQLSKCIDFWESCMIDVYEDKFDAIFKGIQVEDVKIVVNEINSKFSFENVQIELEIWDKDETCKAVHLLTYLENISGNGSFIIQSNLTIKVFDLFLNRPIKVYYEDDPNE